RVMPYTFALIALTVPAFIFLEASLSFLGLGDPSLPTWGHILGDAYTQGALFASRAYPTGLWWWVFFPAAGIIFTTVAFALLGYAFDKVLNPRLPEQYERIPLPVLDVQHLVLWHPTPNGPV